MSRSSSSAVTLRLGARGFGFDTGAGTTTLEPWTMGRDVKGVVAALAELPLPAQPGKSQLAVTLDNAWTRFQLMRFPAKVNTAQEREVFLKASFRRVFGAEVEGWAIAVEPACLGLPVMAVAVDPTLIAALSRLAGRHQMTLRSVQPEFVDAFNRARPMLSGQQGAFAQIGHGRVCMALWRRQTWVAVRSQPMDPAADGPVGAMLAQMLANVDPTMAKGTLHLAGGDDRSPLPEALPVGWTAMRLPAPTP